MHLNTKKEKKIFFFIFSILNLLFYHLRRSNRYICYFCTSFLFTQLNQSTTQRTSKNKGSLTLFVFTFTFRLNDFEQNFKNKKILFFFWRGLHSPAPMQKNYLRLYK